MTKVQEQVRLRIISEYGVAYLLLLEEVANIISSLDKDLTNSNK